MSTCDTAVETTENDQHQDKSQVLKYYSQKLPSVIVGVSLS